MTANNFYKVLRLALADKIPALPGSPSFFTATSIDHIEEAYVVASVSIASRVPQDNLNGDFTAEFTLSVPTTEDWNTEMVEGAFEELVDLLNDEMKKDSLNAVAEEYEIPIVFQVSRWNELETASNDGHRRTQAITFTGIVSL